MSTVDHLVDARRAERTGRAGQANIALHAAFVAALCCLAAGYFGSYASLVHTWAHSGTFEYAFLIVPICAVLVWSRRAALARVSGTPRPRALWLAAALVGVWLLGALTDVNLAQHVAIVALLPTLIYVFYGPFVASVLVFPMGYVFFAVPFGNFMVGPLQDVTAQLSVWALQLTDVPVFKSGRIIQTPAASWHVAEACSGVKFFVATTAFGVLYANLFFTGLRRRLIFVACAMVVPILANGLRVFFTILIGEFFGVRYATGTDHMIFGWQFFGTVLVLLFFAGWPFHQPPRDLVAGGELPAIAPVSGARIVIVGIACVLVLAIGPAWLQASKAVAASTSQPLNLELPATLAGRSEGATDIGLDPGLHFDDPDARATAFYALGQDAVRVDRVAYRGTPGENRELITFGNRLFDRQRWRVTERSRVPAGNDAPAYVKLDLAAREGAARIDLSYAMRVGEHWQTSEVWLKAWQLLYGLAGRPAPTELIAVSEPANAVADASGSATNDRAEKQTFTQAALAFAARRDADRQ